MADALDPNTQWVYHTSRARCDRIDLLELYSWKITEAIALFEAPPDIHGEWVVDQVQAASLHFSQNDDHNPLAKYLVKNANPYPIRSILRSLLRRGTVSAIIERPYFDLEYWDAHAGFYDKCFREHARHCERFHFFSFGAISGAEGDRAPEKERGLLALLKKLLTDGTPWDAICKRFEEEQEIVGYLGYLVLRPTLSFSVVRAAVSFDNRDEEKISQESGVTVEAARARVNMIPLEYGGLPFLKAFHDCGANVLATYLPVKTMAFMQQDPNLGACATVSLWVASRGMAERFGLNRFNYSTITRQALGEAYTARDTVVFDPANLGEGLTTEEMSIALERTGARALAFHAQAGVDVQAESMRLQQEVYSFIESGIPVILALNQEPEPDSEGHAVVVVGHSLPCYETIVKEGYVRPVRIFIPNVSPQHYLVSSLVPVYYVHDDAYGPFNRLFFHADGGKSVYGPQANEYVDCCPCPMRAEPERLAAKCPFTEAIDDEIQYPALSRGGVHPQSMYLQTVLVPVPPMVQGGSFERLNELLRRFDRLILERVNLAYPEAKVLWRSLLLEGAEFKASTVQRKFAGDIIRWYARMALPKYVWLFELSVIENDEQWRKQFAPNVGRAILGEFLVDPTTPPLDFRCLAYRIGGLGCDYSGGVDFPGKEQPAFTMRCVEADGEQYQSYRPDNKSDEE